jgi:ammonia channel protein AmtB
VISIGLFADRTSNYGGSWNSVTGSVTGLFYGGDASQVAAQLVGVSTLVGVVFSLSLVINLAIEFFIGQRVSAETELAGLDIPELANFFDQIHRQELGPENFVHVPGRTVALVLPNPEIARY